MSLELNIGFFHRSLTHPHNISCAQLNYVPISKVDNHKNNFHHVTTRISHVKYPSLFPTTTKILEALMVTFLSLPNPHLFPPKSPVPFSQPMWHPSTSYLAIEPRSIILPTTFPHQPSSWLKQLLPPRSLRWTSPTWDVTATRCTILVLIGSTSTSWTATLCPTSAWGLQLSAACGKSSPERPRKRFLIVT